MRIPNKFNGYSADNRRLYNDPATIGAATLAEIAAPAAIETAALTLPELAATAYSHRNAARLLLVKGSTDYVIRDGEILATVNEPDIPELEAIGGTGDTITGMAAALVYAGLEPHEAAIIASRANRTAGELIKATPATKASELIDALPAVFKNNLCEWSGVCITKGEIIND